MADRIPRREHVMRDALGDARRTLAGRAEHANRSCEDDMVEIGRAIANDDVTSAMVASERAQDPGGVDDQGEVAREQERQRREPAARHRRRSRTSTVDEIRRALSRADDEP